MRGAAPSIADVDLNLHELVVPANLLSDEVLQLSEEEDEEREEELLPFRIDTCCYNCEANVRITLYAVAFGLRVVEQLLLEGKVIFCCVGCARNHSRNGR
ncbi:E7 protein [Human papillomavirus 95]|uniref:Protein E7 n=1 Tax=Human papillomavirus 95 TaxID=260716 RepID=Q705D8_9PAPI|nr:E7 protein [Human papillomavirus 95]